MTIAGEEYLKNESKRLSQEAQEYLTKTDLAIQREAWRRLNESERLLVAMFDLIPKELRETTDNPGDTAEPKENLNSTDNPPVLFSSPFAIPDSEFQIDLPSVVSKESVDGAKRSRCEAGSVTFSIEWPTENGYWRVSLEFHLFGVRGSLPLQDRTIRSWQIAQRAESSRQETLIAGQNDRLLSLRLADEVDEETLSLQADGTSRPPGDNHISIGSPEPITRRKSRIGVEGA